MNATLNNSSADHGDIDVLLTRYFRSEMPTPWPACDALVQARKAARGRNKFRAFSRLALAASVVLFFAAYLTLSGLFPRQQTRAIDDSQNIGSLPGRDHKLQHPGVPQK